ncbi:MAG TPA: hypothetical protein VL461_11155, partial [Dictyobacter sp.]|nr:hypothetical protein [Dictyobacter sp.]
MLSSDFWSFIKSVFESRHLVDKQQKGEFRRNSKKREKEQKRYANNDGEEILRIRSHRCAMETVGTD